MPTVDDKPSNDDLKEILGSTFAPLLSGSMLRKHDEMAAVPTSHVSKKAKAMLVLRPDLDRDDCFLLSRAQEFSDPEVKLAKIGMQMIAEILPHFSSRFFRDMLKASIRRIIAQ